MNAVQEEQKALWNDVKGCAWVEAQGLLDDLFRPLENLLFSAAAIEPGHHVLDVGCGTGGTTVAAARLAADAGQATGIDISEQMIAAANARAREQGVPADFIAADAQHHAFAPASFDRIVSRIGVMFFEDPVAAFTNLRQAAKDGGELHFVAWRSPMENPFMTIAERTAAPLLPGLLPPRDPDAPGQFAFAEERRISDILQDSGWTQIQIRPVDLACLFPETALTFFLSRMGPLGQVLHQVDGRLRVEIIENVRAAFEPYVKSDEVRFTSACWLVSAHALAECTLLGEAERV